MQDELTNEIARVLVETQAATVENRARALRPLIAREVAAQKERDAVIAETTPVALHLAPGMADGASTAIRTIAAAIRSAG
jgi:hypothetical protein